MVAAEDLLAPEVIADPYAYFRALGEADRVHYNPQWGGFVLTRYDDVTAALQDARLSSERFGKFMNERPEAARGSLDMIARVLPKWMVHTDPPRHTRLRILVNKAFTPRAIESMRPRIQRIVDALVDRLEGRGRIDLVADFAYPAPVTVITQMLGVPTEDSARFRAWSSDLAKLVLGAIDQPDRHQRAQESLRGLSEYFRRAIRDHRAAPKDDLLSALIAAEDRHDILDEDELVAMCTLLLFAGHETTSNLIGNAVVALLDHPSQMAELREDPALFTSAVEEFLRYDGPVKATLRIARAPLEMHGKRIEAGQRILLVLAAANRDAARFPDPDRLDLRRDDNAHVAFAYGIHYCLGAALARLSTHVAVSTLLRRLPRLRLGAPRKGLRCHPAIYVRGFEAIPLELD